MKKFIEKKERNYGIDLLKIISMLMVVILHVLGQGGILDSVTNLSFEGEVFWGLEIFCYGAVNIYAIISGMFGYKSKHKGSSIINLCFQVIFFSMIIAGADLIIALINNAPISIENVFFNFFPSIKGYWYFSAYFCLFFFMPIFDIIIDSVPKSVLKSTAFFCFIIFCCWTQFYSNISNLGMGYSILWLALLYLVGGYISKYNPFNNFSFLRCVLIFLICMAITIAGRIAIGLVIGKTSLSPTLVNFFVSYTSPTITIASIFIVLAFSRIKFNKLVNKAIGFFAPLSFGVYLIHCHPIIFAQMKGAFIWILQYNALLGVLIVIGISLIIMLVCMLLDYVRLTLFKVIKIKQLAELIAKGATKFKNFVFKIFHININDNEESDLELDERKVS